MSLLSSPTTMRPGFCTLVLILVIPVAMVLLSTRDMFAPSSIDESSSPDHRNLIKRIEFKEFEVIALVDDAVGPESIAFDPSGGGPYVGVSDGRIIKWERDLSRWMDFAVTGPNSTGCRRPYNHEEAEHTCGRPLGLRFNQKTGDLYIADAYRGLLSVGPNGGLATPVGAQRPVVDAQFWFTNGLDVDPITGDVYFTVSSTRYPRRNYLESIVRGDRTGSLIKYDPTSNTTTTLLRDLAFANGVSLSKNGDFLLALESTTCTLLRYWLKTPNAGTVEHLTIKLPGFPDNIRRNARGEFWVGIYSRRGKLLEWILSWSRVCRMFVHLQRPFGALDRLASRVVRRRGIGMAVKLSEGGERMLEVLEERSGRISFVSEVEEKDGDLWFGSVVMPSVSVIRKYQAKANR